MMAVSDRVLDEIRDRVDIVDLISERTSLRKQGREYVGLCCFHAERSASLSVNAAKGVYLCRGCGEKGDAFDFVRRAESVDFAGAVERLADRLGIEYDQVRGRTSVGSVKPREVTIERLLKTRVPDATWLAFYESGGTYREGMALLGSPAGDARSWITYRAREAWRTRDILTLGRILEALGGTWPEGHRGQWLWITVETLTRDAWWAADTEALARAVDAISALDGPEAAA